MLDLKTTRKPPRLDVGLVAKRIQLDDFAAGDRSATDEAVAAESPEPEAAASEEVAPEGSGQWDNEPGDDRDSSPFGAFEAE